MRIIALDWETGGTDYQIHGLVEIGMALMDGEQVISEYQSLIGFNPKKQYDPEALKVNGRTLDEIKGAPSVNKVWSEVLEWLTTHDSRDLPIVAHNAKFDQGFWGNFMFEAGKFSGGKFSLAPELLFGPWYCTARMADRLRTAGKIPNVKLDTVAAYFGLSRSGETHGALEDSILCGRVFARLRGDVK